MSDEANVEELAEVMEQINQAWLMGRVDDLIPLVHPDVVMVISDFSGRVEGREEFLAGFRDFSEQATMHEFQELDQQIDLIGSTAVINFRYEMVYDYAGERYQASGRDLWLFQKEGATWRAVWRTMIDVQEEAA